MNKTIVLNPEQQAALTPALTRAMVRLSNDLESVEREANGRRTRSQKAELLKHAEALRDKLTALSQIYNQL